MKKSSFFITAFITIFLVSCGHKEETREVKPVRVEVVTIGKSAVENGRTYAGVVEESSGTVLSFKIPGTIRSINVSEGQRVQKGQLIATLDESSLQSNYEIAKSTLATAQDTYNRMKQLHDANSIPEMKWVEVENSLQAAKSACQIAKNALGDTHIYAPQSGVISQKFVDVGSTSVPAAPVVKLVDVSPVKAVISVPESEINRFTTASTASIYVEAADGVTVEGKLSDKGVSADPLSRSYTVKFQTANPDGKLLPGMLCNVTVSEPGVSEAIVVPVEAILLDSGNQTFVWVDQSGKAHKKEVKLGNYMPGGVVVESGLCDGDKLIVAGQQKVSEGMAVTSIKK